MKSESPSEVFSSWSQLEAYLRGRSQLRDELDENNVRYAWSHEGQLMQLFVRHTLRNTGTTWLLFGVRVRPISEVTPESLIGFCEPVGAVAMLGDHLCLEQNLPLRGLSRDVLEATLKLLFTAALGFKNQTAQAAQSGAAALSHFAE